VDSPEFIVDITLFFQFRVVVTIDPSDVVELLSDIVMDAVDISFVCSDEDIECSNGISEVDAAAIEVGANDVSVSKSVLAVLTIPIVVPLVVDVCSKVDGKEYSVEVEILLTAAVVTAVKSAVLVSEEAQPVIISELMDDVVSVSEVWPLVVRVVCIKV
jgi:hypothetical protein